MSNATDITIPEILHEDNHLLVVNKPAGMLTQSDHSGEPCLLEICREYIRNTYAKKGNVFIGMVHRLDKPVGGAIVFARTSKAASRLSAQIRAGEMEKRYLAVVEGPLEGAAAVEHSLFRKGTVTVTVPADTPDAQRAMLKYRSIAVSASKSLVEITLVTGRKHQIRAQMNAIGHPVFGDRKYGSPHDLGPDRIALLSHSLTLKHPTRDETLTFTVEEPGWWPWP